MSKKVKFSLSIPDWLWRIRPKNTMTYLKYKLHPFKCSCCGESVNFKTPEIDCGSNHGRLMLSWWGLPKDVIVCRFCMLRAIKKGPIQSYWFKDNDETAYSNTFGEYDEKESCDVCNMAEHAYKSISIMTPKGRARINFCTNAWNSALVCRECIVDTLTHGNEKSGHYVVSKGKSYPVNEAGLPVINSKVSFPIW